MSFHSPDHPLKVPETSVYDFLFGEITEEDLSRTALVDGISGATTDYRSLTAEINAVAGALATRGIHPGGVVGILSPNIPAFATAFHGILRAGATATTVNVFCNTDDIANQLSDSGARLLFTVSSLLPKACAAAQQIGMPLTNIITLDDAQGQTSLNVLLEEASTPPEITFDPVTHLAVLSYSWGTTGRPKGVKLTHRNLVANVVQIRDRMGVTSDDKVLAIPPFFHIFGMTVLLNLGLKVRASLVTMPRFDFLEFLATLESRRISYLFVAPPIALALAKSPAVDNYDLSNLRMLFSGTAPLEDTLGNIVAKRLTVDVRQRYGMSELSPVSRLRPADGHDVPLNSVRAANANTENKIVDPSDPRPSK